MEDTTWNHEITKHVNALRPLLRRHCPRHYSVEDLVQDTVVEALETVRARGPPDKPRNWLLTVAHRTAVAEIRKRRRRSTLYGLEDSVAENPVEPIEPLIAAEDHSRLRGYMSQLCASDLQVIEGYYLYGLSCKELARDLGITHDGAKSLLYRARRRLRTIAGQNGRPA